MSATLIEAKHDLPLVEVEAALAVGPLEDPQGKEGLTRTACELLRRGAGGRSRAALDDAFDALGASLDVGVQYDYAGFTLKCLARNLDAALALLGDVLARPHLDAEEHEKLRRENLAVLDEVRDDDATLATRYFDRAAIAGHPYGRTAIGTEASLESISRDDVAAWAARNVRREKLLVGFGGDVTAERAHALAARLRDALPTGGAAPATFSPPPRPSGGRRTILVDKPERQQSQILIGHAAPPASHADFLALHVASTVFGGMFTARLMTEVRVKRGWSYGASFRILKTRVGHTFKLRVFPAAEQTRDTLALVLDMWDEITAKGVTAEEVTFAKAYLEGSWAFEIATPADRVERRIETAVMDLPEDWVDRYADRLRAITPDDVNRAIRAWWDPADATIALTCTAETMAPKLAGLPLGAIEVVAYDSY
jgi:zinc protease